MLKTSLGANTIFEMSTVTLLLNLKHGVFLVVRCQYFDPICSINPLNTHLWSYSKIVEEVGEKPSAKAGQSCQYIFVCVVQIH